MSVCVKLFVWLIVISTLVAIGLSIQKKYEVKEVNREVEAVFAKDAKDGWYYDAGDGEILGTAKLIEELDEETLFICLGSFQYIGTVDKKDTFQTLRSKYSLICDGYDPVTRGNRRTEKSTLIWIE